MPTDSLIEESDGLAAFQESAGSPIRRNPLTSAPAPQSQLPGTRANPDWPSNAAPLRQMKPILPLGDRRRGGRLVAEDARVRTGDGHLKVPGRAQAARHGRPVRLDGWRRRGGMGESPPDAARVSGKRPGWPEVRTGPPLGLPDRQPQRRWGPGSGSPRRRPRPASSRVRRLRGGRTRGRERQMLDGRRRGARVDASRFARLPPAHPAGAPT